MDIYRSLLMELNTPARKNMILEYSSGRLIKIFISYAKIKGGYAVLCYYFVSRLSPLPDAVFSQADE